MVDLFGRRRIRGLERTLEASRMCATSANKARDKADAALSQAREQLDRQRDQFAAEQESYEEHLQERNDTIVAHLQYQAKWRAVLEALPECHVHGRCPGYALEWIARAERDRIALGAAMAALRAGTAGKAASMLLETPVVSPIAEQVSRIFGAAEDLAEAAARRSKGCGPDVFKSINKRLDELDRAFEGVRKAAAAEAGCNLTPDPSPTGRGEPMRETGGEAGAEEAGAGAD